VRYTQPYGGVTALNYDPEQRTLTPLIEQQREAVDHLLHTHDSLAMTPAEKLQEWVTSEERKQLKALEDAWWWANGN